MNTSFGRNAKELAGFQILKHRLLLKSLDEIPEPECHVNIIEEANHAEKLARDTECPQLLFPCLFEERARTARENAVRYNQSYWRCFNE